MVETLSGGLGVWYPVLYNAIGMISIVIQILIYQMKTRKAIIFVSMANHVGWFSYFTLQGDFLSGVSNVIGIMSNIVFLMREKYRWADNKLWLFLFLGVGATYSAFTFKSYLDIFPLCGCTSSMTAFFMKKEENIRKISFLTFIFFMCNSISKDYIIALIADITAVTSIVIALIRYRKKETETRLETTEETTLENVANIAG
jgi:hypothetical protein